MSNIWPPFARVWQACKHSCSILLVLSVSLSQAQEINPPYPRLGAFTFSGMTKASIDILKNFDVVAINLDNDQARRYKEQNPNRIVLRTTDSFTGYNLPINLPDQWFAKDVNGQKIELWGGAYIMNLTRYCPKVDIGRGPETFADWLIRWYTESIDFNYYDGIMHDWWWSRLALGRETVDFNNNGRADIDETDIDKLWRDSLIDIHKREAAIPKLKYIIVQIGDGWVAPYVNGANYEDWPDFHGQWIYWKDHHMTKNWEANPDARQPQIMILNAAHTQFKKYGLGVEPYKNNYRAVRFALGSALMGSSFIYVDEGNNLGHHGNFHYYDEFEGKGMLGYPLGPPQLLAGKPKHGTPNASGVWVRFFDHGVALVNVSGVDQTVTHADLAALDPQAGSEYHRILGGQDPQFNNGRKVTNTDPLELWGTTVQRHWPDYDPVGDGTMLFRQPKTLIAPIVVDNHVNNQTSPGSDPIQLSGNWVNSSDGDYYYAFYKDRNYKVFQPDGFAYSQSGNGSVAVYVPAIGTPGYYEVFEWHGYFGSSPQAVQEATNARFEISYTGGQEVKTVDQSQNYGRWNSLGTYFFNTGETGRVTLSANADGVVLADAVSFVFRGSDPNRDVTPPAPPRGVRLEEQ